MVRSFGFRLVCAALLITGPSVFCRAEEDLPPPGGTTNVQEILPASPAPFHAGESLRFLIRYGFIRAGSAWLEVPEVVDWNGRRSWKLVARAESNSFFDRMYKVRNRIESIWDQQGLYSRHYAEDRREGKHTYVNTIEYDTGTHLARYQDGQTYPIPPGVQDALSAFYFTRFQSLPVGGSFAFDYHASRSTQKLEVKVLGRETVSTPAGKFNCIMIEPLLKAGGIFSNRGRLVIWVTDDDRRMPVLMKSKVLIGSISVVLQEIKPGA